MTDARKRANTRIGIPHDAGHPPGQCNLLTCPEPPTRVVNMRAIDSKAIDVALLVCTVEHINRQIVLATAQLTTGLGLRAEPVKAEVWFRAALATLGNLGAA